MGRKQPASATQLTTVDPEPKDTAAAAPASPPAAPKPQEPAADAAGPHSDSAASAGADAGTQKPLDKPADQSLDKVPPTAAAALTEGEPAATPDAEEAARPAPPPRPRPERRVSGFSSNLGELRTAFPEADEGVLRAVLVAASNDLEAAFTGMLAIGDATIRPAAYINAQIERDARLARRLAESQAHAGRRSGHRAPRADRAPAPVQDDLAGDDLYEGFQRGFSDTKQVVSSFWGSLKQRISNEVYDDDDVAGLDDDREPARDQWWPRQPSGGRANPPLPPRKAGARPATARVPDAKPKDAEPKEARSVNAFGDETGTQRKQWEPVQADEPEPDAFFIGESDDDDLGSLNEDAPASAATDKAKAAAAGPESAQPAADKDAAEPKEEPKPVDAEGAEARERRASTAKDLLNKLKLEAGEKAKVEEDRS